MDTQKNLEKRISQLEKRVGMMEEKLAGTAEDRAYMESLYKKARDLVIKHNKASTIFLGRKLWIDFERATKIMDMLQKNGIIGPDTGKITRKILVKK